ncbi:MAG: hypothetical protein AAFR11_07980 [Pseudomonadota bacterium]
MPNDMKTVACMKWGTRYGPEYVNRLHAAVARYTTGDVRFVCFTDDPSGLVASVEPLPLPEIDLPERVRWLPWRKISLWRQELADLSGDVLFLDIDVVILNDLDVFFEYEKGTFCAIENWTQKGQGVANTSVFRMQIGSNADIFETFQADPEAVLAAYRIEQQFVSSMTADVKFWPAEWCVSFKHDLVPRFPLNWLKRPAPTSGARVVAFTGRPDPDEAAEGRWPAPWYKKFYKHARPAEWITERWR